MIHSHILKKGKKKSATREDLGTDESVASGQIYTLKALILGNGPCPFEDWLKSIRDTETKQRIQNRLDRIERGNLGEYSPVGRGVFEIRLMFGAGYRIYYALGEATLIVLLAGGDKSTQDKDIALAHKLWKDYKDETQRNGRDVRQ